MARMRSPNYPALSLGDSIQRVRSLWGKEKKTAVPADVAAKAIGYGGLSGPSRTAIGAMKKYGLVDSDDRSVRVSDLALNILHPVNEDEQLKAMREAALKPELFAALYDSHAHASDDAIKSYLITRLDFSESGARQVIKTFRDTIALAKLDTTEYIPRAVAGIGSTIQKQEIEELNNEQRPAKLEEIRSAKDKMTNSIPAQTFSWPLAPNVSAEVKITGDDIKPEHFEAIRKYAELAGSLVTPCFKEGDTVEYVDAYTGETRYGRIEKMFGGDAIINIITKDEAGPNPKRFTPKADPRIAAITNGTGLIKS